MPAHDPHAIDDRDRTDNDQGLPMVPNIDIASSITSRKRCLLTQLGLWPCPSCMQDLDHNQDQVEVISRTGLLPSILSSSNPCAQLAMLKNNVPALQYPTGAPAGCASNLRGSGRPCEQGWVHRGVPMCTHVEARGRVGSINIHMYTYDIYIYMYI